MIHKHLFPHHFLYTPYWEGILVISWPFFFNPFTLSSLQHSVPFSLCNFPFSLLSLDFLSTFTTSCAGDESERWWWGQWIRKFKKQEAGEEDDGDGGGGRLVGQWRWGERRTEVKKLTETTTTTMEWVGRR